MAEETSQQDDIMLGRLAEVLRGESDLGELAMNTARAMYTEFCNGGSQEQIDSAVRFAQLSLNYTSNDSTCTAARLNDLGVMLANRYERLGDIADLELAIAKARQAVDATSSNHPDRAARLNNLGNDLERQYERTGNMVDLEEAITNARQAIECDLIDNPGHAARLNNLGNKLEIRFARTGQMADLEEAITIARKAVNLMPISQLEKASCLTNLCNKLGRRYERIGNMEDLEAAIVAAYQAVELTPINHPARAGRLNNLGNRLLWRYERTSEATDLEESITITRQAVTSTPSNHPDRARRLSNLGNCLERQYERAGKMTDLEEAITVARQALASTPADHADRAMYLNNLSNKLEWRYERRGEMADLEESITIARQAVESTPADHPDWAGRLNNLGTKLQSRYERTGQMLDLEAAIIIARVAVDSTPADHPDRTIYLNSLGNLLGRRYERTGEMADLEEAITTARQAVDSRQNNQSYLAICSSNLGIKLEQRYKRTGSVVDLEEAITTARQAVDAAPMNHPDRAMFLYNLGNNLQSRYEQTGEIEDSAAASKLFTLAWSSQVTIPFIRILAAGRAMKLLYLRREYRIASEIAEQAVDLLPTVNSRCLDRNDRQHILSTYSGIAADACAILLQCGDTKKALQYLEKGRTVILGQSIDDSTDIPQLHDDHPELASTFETLRREINNPRRVSTDQEKNNAAVQRRRDAAAELDECIKEIQQLPGHTHFMSGLSEEEMKACATDGPIVVVNVSELGSDAIIVSPGSIASLALPNLSPEVAKTWISRNWQSSDRSGRRENNPKYREYLEWLWDACVRSVLDAVGLYENEPGRQLPRIWWVGSGLASSMPFHAAGVYSSWTGENALRRVVSSYAPSIKALANSRIRYRHERAIPPKVLIATMPVTPGLKSLPGVGIEKEGVARVLGACTMVEDIEQPSADTVAQRLTQCNIAHFACHGQSDPVDPSNSGLIFAQKDENGNTVQDTLTVHKISETKLRNVRLAYLSACSTAENKAARLADEAIHVASGFQVAGFPHVVGCLWPSVDQVCAEVAHSFYVFLTQQGGIDLESRTIAMALHQSVLAVAARDWKRPLNWAQFVHYGA